MSLREDELWALEHEDALNSVVDAAEAAIRRGRRGSGTDEARSATRERAPARREERCVIYGLECAGGKYYVGRALGASAKDRIDAHFRGDGAAWTMRHKPLKVVFEEEGDRFDEDKHVVRLMRKYGIENVRGGTFSREYLPYAQKNTIKDMLRGSSDACFHCGKTGHFVNDCPELLCARRLREPEIRRLQELCRRSEAESDPCEAFAKLLLLAVGAFVLLAYFLG